MATTIVPAASSPINTSDVYQATYNEVLSLAHELCEAEGLTLANAMVQAANDLDFNLFYAQQWDRMAFHAGNDDALPF